MNKKVCLLIGKANYTYPLNFMMDSHFIKELEDLSFTSFIIISRD